MNKKIIGIVFGAIIIISSVVFLYNYAENTKDSIDNENEDYTTDDIIDEIDGSLLGEDDEVEIGEMV
ncbi:MAG: hypothetical protein JXA91_02940 [Candidatus Thermoplasmatota archaeon]|nr:hypothetical protein [Candidatus Thermoplasmatota archaeon]